MSKNVCKICGATAPLGYPLLETEADLVGLDAHAPGYILVDAELLRPVWRLVADRRRGGARGRQARTLETLMVGLWAGEQGMIEEALVGLFAEQLLSKKRGPLLH